MSSLSKRDWFKAALSSMRKKKKREAIDRRRMLGRMTAFQQKKKNDVAIKSRFGRSSWKIAGDRNVIFQVQKKKEKKKRERETKAPPPHPLHRFQSLFLRQWFDARGDRFKERDCLGLLNIL